MPRGYLKHKNREVGRKTARGNSSRQPQYPGRRSWRRMEKRAISQRESAVVKGYVFDYGYEDIHSDYYDHLEQEIDSIFAYHDEPPVSPSKDESDTPASCPSDVPLEPVMVSDEESVVEEDGFDKFEIEGFSGRRHFGVHRDDFAEAGHSAAESSFSLVNDEQSSSSYSLCDFTEGSSSSFSIIQEDNASSASTTIWEFVANSIGHPEECNNGTSSRVHCITFGNTELNETDDSISCVSQCTVSVQTPTLAPRLFAPSRCAICLEEKVNVLRLMHKCNHPSACLGCLRTHYVEYGLKDTANFPLRCFWPGCKRILRDAQIRPLTRNQNEMDIFYQQQREAHHEKQVADRRSLEKGTKKLLQEKRVLNFKLLQSCARCSKPNPVRPVRQSHYQCAHCNVERPIDVISLEEVRSIVAALGDCLVNCPACEALIIKDGGCDHMTCICKEDFSFQKAQDHLISYREIVWQIPRNKMLGSEPAGSGPYQIIPEND